MQRRTMKFVAAALGAAVVVPTAAFANARRTESNGSLAAQHRAETPYVARLLGANETPNPGDPDATGAATVSFHQIDATDTQACWDLSYKGLDAPTAAHIHEGATGVAGPIRVDFGAPGASGHSGCATITNTLANQIIATPANFYVNVHNAAYPTGAIRGQLALGAAPAGATHLLPTPLRAYDSRVDGTKVKLAGAETRTISLADAKNLAGDILPAVPPGATGAYVTLTLTLSETGGGFIKIYSATSPEPPTSNINWAVADENLAVSTLVAVDAAGQIKVTGGVNATHFIIDVIGYTY